MDANKKPRQSLTPLRVGLYEGVTLEPQYRKELEEKGYAFEVYNCDDMDIHIGPHLYNWEGELDKKTFHNITTSARQLCRARKKREKEEAKKLKQSRRTK